MAESRGNGPEQINSKGQESVNKMSSKSLEHASQESTPAGSNTPEDSIHESINDGSLVVPPTRRQQYAILATGWMATFQVVGFSQGYGIFQSFHSDRIGDPGALLPDSHADQRGLVALIGSLSSASISMMLGILMTPILDHTVPKKWRFGERSGVTYLMFAGSGFLGLGYFLSALSNKLWQLFLAQGVIVGFGGALLWYPVQTISAEYFKSRRALASGLIASGGSLGGLFYAPVVHYLLNAIGIRKTYHVLAGSQLMIGIILAVFTPPPRPITGQRKFFPRSIWSRAAFYLMIIGGFAYQMVLNQPAIFGPDFTTTLGYTSKFAAIWLAVLNSIGAPTRLILGWVGDQIGRQGTSIFSILITVVSSLGFWMASALLNSRALFWLFTVTYGSMAAGFNQFMGPVLLDIFDSEVFFSVNAAVSFARGVGSLVGSPIGGAILGSREGRRDLPKNYARLAAFTGSLLAVQLVCCCVVWLISRFERLKRLIL